MYAISRRRLLQSGIGAVGMLAVGSATGSSAAAVRARRAIRDGSPQETIDVEGIERTYFLHVPASYVEGTPTPLLFMLHGFGEDGALMERRTGMSDRDDDAGFLAVYPNATGNVPDWNPWFDVALGGRNDLDFLGTLVKRLSDRYTIDPTRIFVAGHSAGAMMVYAAGAAMAETFAAIGVVAGTIGARIDGGRLMTIAEPAAPVSLIAFHGKRDRLVPYDGGIGAGGIDFVSVADSIAFWVEPDGCDPAPAQQTSAGGNVVHDVYTGGEAGVEVELYTIENGGHFWPGGLGEPDNGIDATNFLWEFFSAHPKP